MFMFSIMLYNIQVILSWMTMTTTATMMMMIMLVLENAKQVADVICFLFYLAHFVYVLDYFWINSGHVTFF